MDQGACAADDARTGASANKCARSVIEELIKTHNIAALIKTEQQKWDAC